MENKFLTKDGMEELAKEIKELETIITSNPKLIAFVKQLVWNSVCFTSKLQAKIDNMIIRRDLIDLLTEVHLNIKETEELPVNPYDKESVIKYLESKNI